jgi:hypothetical protein
MGPPIGIEPFQFAGFEVLQRLGKGGIGSVFLARRDGRLTVLKILEGIPNPDETSKRRFNNTVGRLLKVRHPNLVPLLDSGIGTQLGVQMLWLQMPYIEGARSLRDLLAEVGGSLPAEQLRGILADCAEGLGELHRWSIVHRDLKPENVLVEADGRALLIDFDISRAIDRTRLTAPGQRIGTLPYMAPEQLDGDCLPGSDLWALAVIGVECLTGRHPFSEQIGSERSLVRAIREGLPLVPSRLALNVPGDLEALLLGLLDKLPWRRAGPASQVARVLRDPSHRLPSASRPWARETAPRISVIVDGRSMGAVRRAVEAGSAPDQFVVPITQRHALDAMRSLARTYGSLFAVDLLTPRLARTGWWHIKSLHSPYAPPEGESLRATQLEDGRAAANFARETLRAQDEQGVDVLRAPHFGFADLDSPEAHADMVLLEQSLAERSAFQGPNGQRELHAVVRLPISTIEDWQNHIRLLGRLACRPTESTVLWLEGLSPTTSPGTAVSMLRLALLLQDSGQPVDIVCSGPLRWVTQAFGVAGVQMMPGRYETLEPIREIDANRRFFPSPRPRFDFPSLLCSLPVATAVAVLESGLVPESTCFCPGCAGRSAEAKVAEATVHGVWAAMQHANSLAGISPADRVATLKAQIDIAHDLHRKLIMRGIWSGDLALLQRLALTVAEAESAGLLERRLRPIRRVARQH